MFTLDRFDRPAFLWLIVIAAVMWWMSRRSLAGLGPIRKRLCLLTRSAVVVLLALAAAGANRLLTNDDLTVLFLLDQSHSVPVENRRSAEQFVQSVTRDMRVDDRTAVLTFDGQTHIEQLASRPGLDGGLHVPPPFADGARPDQTNLSQALRMAKACAPDDTAKRIVLISDGNQNVGDVLTEAATARANNITIDVVPFRRTAQAETVFEQLRAPSFANLHEVIPLRMTLRRTGPATTGTILVYKRVGQDDELIDLKPDSDEHGERVRLEPGPNVFTLRLPIQQDRAHEFRAEFIPDDKTADAVPQNNVARAFTNVQMTPTVLYLGTERDRDDDAMLVEALGRENIRVDWQTAESINVEPAVLQDYAAVVLSNVPAESFSAEQQLSLANYVRDLGGGLIMIGGDESFGAGGWQGSIVEDIMPVKFDVDAVKQIPRGALAIVMHSCEMPQGNKWGIEVAVAALKTVSRLDYFGVVGLGAGGVVWEVPMQPAMNKEAITQQIRRMQNGDLWDFDSSINMAYQGLMGCRDAAQRHMIIISDGDASPATSGVLNKLVGSKVTCSTVCVFPHGGGSTAEMQRIARITGGTFYGLNKPGDEQRLPKIFTKEARIVRRPLIRDEVFVPKIRPNLSELMTGVDAFPELKGYVVTTPRGVMDVEMPLVTDKGDPLFAHWLCGFGRTVAFTSGRWKHWGADWPGWPSFSKFWAQTVRWCMQQGSSADFDVSTVVEGDQGHIVIEATNPESGPSFRQFRGRVVRPDGRSMDLPVTQTGPGRYEARFDARDKGSYLVNVLASGGADEKPAMIRTGVTVAFSPEFKDLTANEALLTEIAETTEGRVLGLDAPTETVFAHNLPPTIARQPIWETLLKLAIVVFLMDVAVRRVAIDPIKVVAFARGYVASLAGRFYAGRRAEETLADLKDVRARVRTERTGAGDMPSADAIRQPAGTQPQPSAGGPDASAKFEADAAARRPSGDLTKLVGGAQADSGAPAKSSADAGKKDEPPKESTTARLLKAKRKTRSDQDPSTP